MSFARSSVTFRASSAALPEITNFLVDSFERAEAASGLRRLARPGARDCAFRPNDVRNQLSIEELWPFRSWPAQPAKSSVWRSRCLEGWPVEHYEIARYGTLIAWAKQLGRSDCASVLHENLEEEKAADRKLTEIAESQVNLQASA